MKEEFAQVVLLVQCRLIAIIFEDTNVQIFSLFFFITDSVSQWQLWNTFIFEQY